MKPGPGLRGPGVKVKVNLTPRLDFPSMGELVTLGPIKENEMTTWDKSLELHTSKY